MFFSHVYRPRTITGLALLTAVTAACSATIDSEPVTADESSIIGGVTTSDPAFDAVGVLGAELPASLLGLEPSENRLVLFTYPEKGRVEVGTYRLVMSPKPPKS